MTSFDLGTILATPGALALLGDLDLSPLALLTRHAAGDWGDIAAEDRGLNGQALRDGSRLFSVYQIAPSAVVWVITEALDDDGHRAATTLEANHMAPATGLTTLPAICPTCGYRTNVEVAENGSVALDVCEHLDPDPEPDPAGSALLPIHPDLWDLTGVDARGWAMAA